MTAWVVTVELHSPLTASWLIAEVGMLNRLASVFWIVVALFAATVASGSSLPVLIWYDALPLPFNDEIFTAEATSAPVLSTAPRASCRVPTEAGRVKELPPLNSIPRLNG